MSVIIKYEDENGMHQESFNIQRMLDAMLYSELYKDKKIVAIIITQ